MDEPIDSYLLRLLVFGLHRNWLEVMLWPQLCFVLVQDPAVSSPPLKFFSPSLEKSVGHSLSLKNLGPSEKTL